MFFNSKGGASKTTYSRLRAEHFKRIELFLTENKGVYSTSEINRLISLFESKPYLRVFNITRDEISIRKYKQFLDDFDDIKPTHEAITKMVDLVITFDSHRPTLVQARRFDH